MNKTIKAVLVHADRTKPFEILELDRSQYFRSIPVLGDGYPELHMTAYSITEKIQDPELAKIHRAIMFACDEDGLAKNLSLNENASLITGLRMCGPVVFMMEREITEEQDSNNDSDDDEGEGVLVDLSLETVQRLFEATKNH